MSSPEADPPKSVPAADAVPAQPPTIPGWQGAEATVAGLPAFRASGEHWEGGERTVSDMPALRADGAAWRGGEQTQREIPLAHDGGNWAGGERTQAAIPLSDSGAAWAGGELTQSAMPIGDGTADYSGGERTRSDLGVSDGAAWSGGERTLTDLSGDNTPGPLSGGTSTVGRAGTGRQSRGSTGTGTQRKPGTGTQRRANAAEDGWHLQGREGPLTGHVFGEYEIGGIIGEGGMGTIYRARQASLQRKVAVKVLPSALAADPIVRSRFEQEARTASLIQSPFVVQVFAAGNHNDISYFVMEFVEGSDLSVVIRERSQAGDALEPATAADYVLQAAKGLAEAGRHGVVHRDIKPANLLLTSAGAVKIADFGISKVAGESALTRTGTAIGTPSYVSPEQGRGEPCDPRSDLYSLGVVFYELLTNRKPFEGTTANAIIYQHNYAEPKLPRELDPTIPEHYQAVVLKCLQKDPAKRYQDASELVSDLERIRAGNLSLTAMFVGTYGTGADEAMRKYLGRQRRWVAWTVAALLLVALAGVGGLWWRSTNADERTARRDEIGRLKTGLAALNSAVPVPVNAAADVARLATLVGKTDGDVANWNDKLAKVTALHRSLARLDEVDVPPFSLRGEAEKELAALVTLVGAKDDRVLAWRAKLDTAKTETDKLSQQLAPHRDAEATVALQKRLTALVARLSVIDGERNPDVVRFTQMFKTAHERAKSLHDELMLLDRTDVALTEADARRYEEVLVAYAQAEGATPTEAVRWRERLRTALGKLDQLRVSLGRVKATEVVSAGTQGALKPILAEYRLLVAVDDALLREVDEKLVHSAAVLAAQRDSLAFLDRPDVASVDQLRAGRAAHDALAPLAAPDDADLRRWGAALRAAEDRVTVQQTLLTRLDRDDPVTVADQAACEVALAELDVRLALGEDKKIAYRRRLIAERERVDMQRRRLKENVGSVRVSKALADDITAFGLLVGDQDADYVKWRVQIVDYVRLRGVLESLDKAEPIPDQAEVALTALTRIAGEDNEDVKRWRAKLTLVARLRGELATLSVVAPVPPGATAKLDDLVAAIGEFAEAPEWRAKITAVDQLRGRLATLDQICLLPAGADADLASLGQFIGRDGRELLAWEARIAALRGPGRPPWASDYAVDQHGPCAVLTIAVAGAPTITFRYCPPGRFTMGSPPREVGREADENQVEVVLTKGFWIADSECTQAVWRGLTGAQPSAHVNPDCPVESVSWDDVKRFLIALNAKVGDMGVRLPTEAEWEYACRASSSAPFSSWRGPVEYAYLDQVAWYAGNVGETQPVKRRLPNAIGLFDLHGNVWEWCEDGYGLYPPVAATDPVGLAASRRVARGGSWGDRAKAQRAANRLAVSTAVRSAYLGFRPVVSVNAPAEER